MDPTPGSIPNSDELPLPMFGDDDCHVPATPLHRSAEPRAFEPRKLLRHSARLVVHVSTRTRNRRVGTAELLANISFSNAFSNADGYVRSRRNAGELKPDYRNKIRSPTIAGELKTTAWHATEYSESNCLVSGVNLLNEFMTSQSDGQFSWMSWQSTKSSWRWRIKCLTRFLNFSARLGFAPLLELSVTSIRPENDCRTAR